MCPDNAWGAYPGGSEKRVLQTFNRQASRIVFRSNARHVPRSLGVTVQPNSGEYMPRRIWTCSPFLHRHPRRRFARKRWIRPRRGRLKRCISSLTIQGRGNVYGMGRNQLSVSRRALLLFGAAAVSGSIAGCNGDGGGPAPTADTSVYGYGGTPATTSPSTATSTSDSSDESYGVQGYGEYGYARYRPAEDGS